MTEKNYNPQQRTEKAIKKQQNVVNQKIENKAEIAETKKEEKHEEKIEDKKNEIAKEKETKKEKTKPKIKKDEAVVNGISLPISTKISSAVCKFIRGKSIEKALADLEDVTKFKRAIPMTGEIPHRKGKGMMSGRYHVMTVAYFIKLLKALKANSIMNGIEEPIIVEAVPNRASRPRGRFGAVKRKRTHVKIKCMEKSKLKEKKK